MDTQQVVSPGQHVTRVQHLAQQKRCHACQDCTSTPPAPNCTTSARITKTTQDITTQLQMPVVTLSRCTVRRVAHRKYNVTHLPTLYMNHVSLCCSFQYLATAVSPAGRSAAAPPGLLAVPGPPAAAAAAGPSSSLCAACLSWDRHRRWHLLHHLQLHCCRYIAVPLLNAGLPGPSGY